jgi:hypothetical protein
LGPASFHHLRQAGQEPCPAHRARRCLLKGCERCFLPPRPQSRYCSAACAAAARRWRHVKASRQYRATDEGRARRRAQHRRYRQRRHERTRVARSAAAAGDAPAAREGQRPAWGDENFCQRMCDRPGCYVTFLVTTAFLCRRFCSVACRLALRRVLDREARYRQRRRRWRRQRRQQRGGRPDTS